MPWTIGGDTLEDLDVTSLVIEKHAGARDRASFVIARDGDAAAPFSVDDDVDILAPDEATFFRGIVRVCTPDLSGSAEVWRVELDGRFAALDEIPLLQPRGCAPESDPEGDPVIKYDSKCVLGWDDDGVRQNTAEIITGILTYAAGQDSNLTTGTILSGVDITVPQMEVTDVVCSEAIRSVLRWHPDAVLWYDHGSDEVNVTRPGAMSTVTKAASGDGCECVALTVAPRVVRKVRGVRIFWRVTSTVDNVQFVDTTEDAAGETTGRRIVAFTIDLAGSQTVTQEQEIVTEDIPEAPEDVTGDWLKQHIPEIAATDIDLDPVTGYVAVDAVTQTVKEDEETGPGTTLGSYARQLISGSVQPWMAGISACPVEITITLRWRGSRASNTALYDLFQSGKKTMDFTVRVMATDATTKTYKTVATQVGETPPTGLAEDYLTALNTDWPEGFAVFESEEVMGDIKPGVKLSLTGAVAVTGALVQSVTYDVMAGRTAVTFGPAGRLDPNDLVELMRAGARSRPVVNGGGGFRTSGAPSGGHKIKGATGGRQTNTTRRPPARALMPFEVTQAGAVSDGKVSVKVAPGVVNAGTGLSGGTPDVADAVRSYTTLETTVTDVEDGHSIWAKIGMDQTSADGMTAWEYSGLDSSERFVTQATRPATEPGTPMYVYAEIARVDITDDVVTIQQVQHGPLSVPMTTLVDGGGAGAASALPYYWTTEYVDSDSVTVKRGCLLSWSYYLSTPGTVAVQQTMQTDWGVSGAAGVSSDIPVNGLSDGDYLWVEIPLLVTDTDFLTTGTYAGGDLHDHSVPSTFGQVQGGGSIPFINFGASISMTDDVVKIPFAQFVDGGVTQLHVGVMVCPPFFSLAAL